MAKQKSKQAGPKVVYDPKKSYTWEPTDTFTLSGEGFGIALNLLLREKEELIAKARLLNQLEELLKAAVEDGVASEQSSEGQG